MKLLLIDEDRELVAVPTLALERAGYTVSTARDAAMALALLDADRPDLVVLGTPPRQASPAAPQAGRRPLVAAPDSSIPGTGFLLADPFAPAAGDQP
jgi:hypothetical protein